MGWWLRALFVCVFAIPVGKRTGVTAERARLLVGRFFHTYSVESNSNENVPAAHQRNNLTVCPSNGRSGSLTQG